MRILVFIHLMVKKVQTDNLLQFGNNLAFHRECVINLMIFPFTPDFVNKPQSKKSNKLKTGNLTGRKRVPWRPICRAAKMLSLYNTKCGWAPCQTRHCRLVFLVDLLREINVCTLSGTILPCSKLRYLMLHFQFTCLVSEGTELFHLAVKSGNLNTTAAAVISLEKKRLRHKIKFGLSFIISFIIAQNLPRSSSFSS